ncbi:hypothetical protein CMI46_02005 [Candidatus Pacearchaeota archaeon]|nr:hypothetical protein [Candidatus Pacearchaeota archaeon]|tara:strand:+ start:3074 stop:3880 length:807 start_codon:yes stop_codon:yes gene_type:complete
MVKKSEVKNVSGKDKQSVSGKRSETASLKKDLKKTDGKDSKKEDKENVYKIDLFGKLKQLYFHPNDFFKSVEKEKNYWPILKSYMILYLIGFVISILVGLYLSLGEIDGFDILSGLIVAIIFSLTIPFAMSGIVYVGTRIFRSKQEFFNTFKPIAYALMIGVVYSIIVSLILIFLPIDSSMLDAIENSQDIDAVKSAYKEFLSQPGTIVNLIISFISLIHVFVLSTMGIAKFHKMSKAKAGVSIVLSVVGALIVFVLIGIVFGMAGVK